MSQSPNILVAVGGQSDRGYIPQQTYTNLFTEFNINGVGLSDFNSDADFYNTKIITPSTQGKSDFDIYGFMLNDYEYTNEHSMQTIVDFFQQDKRIDIVVSDILHVHANFSSYTYINPYDINNNIPFFVRSNLVDQINFVDEKLLLQEQLNRLKQQNIIFHIASPLLSFHHTPLTIN